MVGDHAKKDEQRQEAQTGRDSYVAGRDLTINIYSSLESADLIAGFHKGPGCAPTMGVEIIMRRRFVMDWESKRPRLADAEGIMANNSMADIIINKVGLKPVGFPGPAKLVSGKAPQTIEPGKAASCMLQAIDFADILVQVSNSGRPGEPAFSVYAESGYGSARKIYCSEPFSLEPRSTRPLDAGFNEWTE
jgi:hypothetical protein